MSALLVMRANLCESGVYVDGAERTSVGLVYDLEQLMTYYFILFFFSSRRRHTRLQGDWSSDVCSSDLQCTNSVNTRFGNTNGYQVLDGLDQEETNVPIYWRIFYDPLLAEIKRQRRKLGDRKSVV